MKYIDDPLALEFAEDIAFVLGADNLKKFAGKTILLLGGSGFLGTLYKLFFIYCNNNSLINLPCKIVSVDNYIKGTVTINDEIKDYHLISINHDLTLPLGLKLNGLKIDFIINCAGNASPRNYETYPLETMEISTIGVRHVFELAYQHKCRVLNFSSSEVLGTPEDEDIPTNETVIPKVHTLNKRAPYDVGKMYIEAMSWVFRNKYNVDCCIVRPFNVVGRFARNDYRVIPNYLDKLFKNEKIQVYKPGTQTRTFCYYTDFLVGSLLVLLNANDLLYHIGNPYNEIGMYDLALKLQTHSGKSDLVQLVDTPDLYKHEPVRRCPSINKAHKELGYMPKINLDQMLTRIYNWAVVNYK